MKFVGNVIGTLKIEALKVEISHSELIDLTPEDLKAYPELREAIIENKLVKYDPLIHTSINIFRKRKIEKPLNELKNDTTILLDISNKLDQLIGKISSLNNEDKFIKLLEKMDNFVNKVGNINTSINYTENSKKDNTPIFIPNLKTDSIETKIKTENSTSEGTKNILEQLRGLKK